MEDKTTYVRQSYDSLPIVKKEKLSKKPQRNHTMSRTTRNAGKPWSQSEEEELIRNVQQYRGSIREVAEVHGRSPVAINMRIASIVRRMVNAEGMAKSTVANLFFKSSEDVDELLRPPSSSANKRVSSMQQLDMNVSVILDRLDVIEQLLLQLIKKNKKARKQTSSPSLDEYPTEKKKTKTKKKKKQTTSSSPSSNHHDLFYS